MLVERLRNTPEYKSIHDATVRMLEAGDPNYMELSIAAKAYFLLKKQGSGMSARELIKQAEKYSWNISPQSVDRAISFLKAIQLAH